MSSEKSLNISELFRFKDLKTWISAYSLKSNFDKLTTNLRKHKIFKLSNKGCVCSK